MFKCEFEIRNVLDIHYVESESIWQILAVMIHVSNYYSERVTLCDITY